MKYAVQVQGHGEPLVVEVAERISFAAPAADLSEARQLIAQGLVKSIMRDLHDVPASKVLERDSDGRIVRSIDHPGITRGALAEQVAWEVAGRHLEGAVDE